jgi:hypothetical protein
MTDYPKSIAERDRRSQINIEDLTVCYYCKATGLTEEHNFCPNCGFPQRGEQLEMKKFLYTMSTKKRILSDKKSAVKKAKNILFILAGLNLVIGLFLGLIIQLNVPVLINCIVMAIIYFSLGLWCRKHPFPAILSGFFVYIVVMVIGGIIDPHTIYKGIILKVIIISGFIYGFKGVNDAKKLEDEVGSIEKGKDLNLEI